MDQISFPEEKKKKKTNFAAEHFESSHAFSHLVTILVRSTGGRLYRLLEKRIFEFFFLSGRIFEYFRAQGNAQGNVL